MNMKNQEAINPFAIALSGFSQRLPREARDIEVLRVSAQLSGDDFAASADAARKAALAWAKKRAGRALPKEAWDLQDFELFAGGRNSSAVRISNADLDVWALRAEDPDKNVAGRVWTTEIVVGGQSNARPHVSLRLVVSTAEPEFRVEPHVPGPVLQMIDAPGLVSGARTLASSPTIINSENDVHDLCDYLEDPARKLPVFVCALAGSDGIKSSINVDLLAKATAGMARVFCVPAPQAWVITERFGRFLSVFNGGVRAYLPGFSISDDPFRHRLFLASDLKESGGAAACVRSLRSLAATSSISETRLGKDILEFAAVRTASRKLKKSYLNDQAASGDDLLKVAEELVTSLEQQVEEKDREIDGYVAEVESSEARALSAEQENRALLYQVRQLKDVLATSGEGTTAEPPIPQDWSEFGDWLDQTYPDKIALSPAARRLARSPEFEDVALVARSIVWLATVQHDRRINGGGPLRDENIESGILNAPCGGDSYSTNWKGRSYEVDYHVKNGGNVRDPKRCLRIYYFWEPGIQQTVIDALPAHRKTGMT